MPQTIEVALLLLGAILFLVGIIGGGTVVGVIIPPLEKLQRIIIGSFGIGLIVYLLFSLDKIPAGRRKVIGIIIVAVLLMVGLSASVYYTPTSEALITSTTTPTYTPLPTATSTLTNTPTIIYTPTPFADKTPPSLSLLCEGKEPLIFHDGLPENDPCEGKVASGVVPGIWVVVEPRTDRGWQTGKCLYRYPDGDRNGIYEGSIWALFRGNSQDNKLPTCPETK